MSNPERHEAARHEPVTPMAYFDDESGPRLVVQFAGTEECAVISPPNHDIAHTPRSNVVLASAIAKHGFHAFTEKQPEMTNIQDYIAALAKKNLS